MKKLGKKKKKKKTWYKADLTTYKTDKNTNIKLGVNNTTLHKRGI